MEICHHYRMYYSYETWCVDARCRQSKSTLYHQLRPRPHDSHFVYHIAYGLDSLLGQSLTTLLGLLVNQR